MWRRSRIAPAVSRLWDVCQIPDYRKISSAGPRRAGGHALQFLMEPARSASPRTGSPSRWRFADRTDGDIDTLANRIAHIRTWTFVANRADWLADPEHWQDRTRAIEDSLRTPCMCSSRNVSSTGAPAR